MVSGAAAARGGSNPSIRRNASATDDLIVTPWRSWGRILREPDRLAAGYTNLLDPERDWPWQRLILVVAKLSADVHLQPDSLALLGPHGEIKPTERIGTIPMLTPTR